MGSIIDKPCLHITSKKLTVLSVSFHRVTLPPVLDKFLDERRSRSRTPSGEEEDRETKSICSLSAVLDPKESLRIWRGQDREESPPPPPFSEVVSSPGFTSGLAEFCRSRCHYRCPECAPHAQQDQKEQAATVVVGRLEFFTHVSEVHQLNFSQFR